jgi:ParB family chromosome partitioning protein
MASSEKPVRLGRGLDALLSRRESPRTQGADASAGTNTTTTSASKPPSDSERRAIGKATATSESGTAALGQADKASGLRSIPIVQIAANPFQPRKEFRPEDLADLESSLRTSGILQPITVRPSPHHSGFELIAGERRLRAATRLGWTEIPALVRSTDDRTMLTLAMVENLQRADLDPIEEADGYQRLIDEFSLTQQEVAEVVGKDRSTIANALRLLALPASVKRMLQDRQITVGHARALLPLANERAMADMSRDIVTKSLSVRDVETRVRGARPAPATTGRKSNAAGSASVGSTPGATAELRRVEELLRKKMQTTVSLHLTGKQQGEVRIAFFSNDDLERVLAMLGIDLDS